MKNSLIVSIIILFTLCNLKLKAQDANLKIEVNIVDRLESSCFESLADNYYFAYVELFNNNDSIFKFWTMTCSWQDNWIFKTDNISLYYRACTRNFPILIQLKPKEKMVYKGIICIKGSLESIKDKNLKLGLVLIKENELKRESDFHNILKEKINNSKDIIWSKPFNIKT